MIQLFNVTKIYQGDIPALEGITMHIDQGEFVFITGKSGAGKTSLLRLMFRAELPTKGTVLVNNFNIARLQRQSIPFLRRNIGVVFQDFKLLPQKTVFENIAFALEVVGTPRREITQRVLQVLQYIGLTEKRNILPLRLSGGEQQRVAIGRAIVNKPPILLADEPTGNLDPEISLDIMRLFQHINQQGTTVVVATHDVDLIKKIRKKVFCLDQGKLIDVIPMEEVASA
ncbi:cell division ATP-binding protein FtsE [candidate division KSB3 bacterium]|uniref:Cell division ATP-binding protein FtsE n=1 Tax=candidate division KSB3 bacterium TaxID=2044937 RepID=A0A9D5Q6G7_9BACT|nr:cell division ATP-binding protein FtsE [candidate division KSB3 bacterium]MBD3325378.1 cell division ATP-binding protein FtsE [candidate division KSB3 bacterium]